MSVRLRFRRSIKIAPFVHLNLGLRGAGVSVGPHGLHVGVSTRNGPYASAGIPGTGVYAMYHRNGQPRGRAIPLWLIALAVIAIAVWREIRR